MMMRGGSILTLGLLLGSVALAPQAFGHVTYNLSGNNAPGIPGSVPGSPPSGTDDGSVTSDGTTWTSGIPEGYAGKLPVNWYAGMHQLTHVRTLQAGAAPNPPAGSLRAAVVSHNADPAEDPDLPEDRVLAVGGLSWSDPGNGNQGWGMGLDYGIIHYDPLTTFLSAGPAAVTITLADDPSDGVAVQLAFALYGGWDTSSTASRHDTFTTSPSPVDNPLGSTGLTFIDHMVASGAGQTISRTFILDETYGGHYTVLVGALGGVSGQYQLTVSTAQLTAEADPDLAQCQEDLATMTNNFATATADADGDGKRDQDDTCSETQTGAAVDAAGCSQTQFCSAIDVSTKSGRKLCPKADWKNDQPVMKKKDRDCEYDKSAKLCRPAS